MKASKRHSLTVRVTPELRERMEAAASTAGRSMAQEMEERLERSFLPDLFAKMQDIQQGHDDDSEENLLRAVGRPLRAALELLLPNLHSFEIALINAAGTGKGTEYRAFSEQGWKLEKGATL